MEQNKKYKIIIVDDNEGFIEAIKIMLKTRNNMEVVAKANNAHEFFNLLETVDCNLILMDINMPDINGLVAAKKALIQNHLLIIIGVTMHDDYNIHHDMLRFGFLGGILKNNFSIDFNNAINAIENGEIFFPVLS